MCSELSLFCGYVLRCCGCKTCCFFIVDVATGMLRSNSTAENIEWQDGMFFSFKLLCLKVVGNVKLDIIREMLAFN